MARVKVVQPRISFADLERAPEIDAGTSSTMERCSWSLLRCRGIKWSST